MQHKSPCLYKSRAFTLVEILVVISIIGLLVALLVPSLSQARERSVVLQCQTQLRGIGIASIGYAADNKGSYSYSYSMLAGGPEIGRAHV